MTPYLDSFLSPHAQQGIIAGLFIAVGWIVAARQNRNREGKQRGERSRDIQRALLAEIRAHVATLEAQRMDEAALRTILAGDHVPVIPKQANDRIYVTVLKDVHLLPELIIDPVVTYYRQIAMMGAFAEALEKQAEKDRARAIGMFVDYLEMTEAARESGQEAMRLLMTSVFLGEEALRQAHEKEREALLADIARLPATLPAELAELRDRLNRRSSGRSDP
ncbi:hypothetical protein [Paracoccus laeviglucosivorans]|uniref:Uncharacterized protein n=1 Tax=Paracoccus laeviglucosivorans TaxID=1197861 RepID=A0A521C887_9RHOB|nr:hypothetical protein [Paracoccus laeviglucosivorans]SMO55603.1 hypothetical protein SAMN06265221_10465 [Paracoccus laeviglucosivorans]